jgi:ABC-2 type transport system permease protein
MTVSEQVQVSQKTVSQTPNLTQSLSRRGLASQIRALLAVMRREWVIFLRYPSWVVGLIIWPVIFPAGYILTGRALAGPDGSGLALFNQAAGTQNFLGYIAIGTTVWMWQNIVLWNVGLTLRDDQLRGTLETNWLSPTWRFSFLLGSSITELITMLLFLVVSFVEFALIFGVRLHGNPFMVLLVLLAAIPSIYGLGFAFASLVITVKEANAFVYMVRGMVMIFSGITFPVLVLPGWMQSVSRWLPQTTIIHAMRSAMLSGADFQTLLPDLEFLLVSGAALLLAGYLIFVWMERRARRTGAIGEY